MDETTFDALARSVFNEAGTRRAVVRLLSGSVLGAIVSHLSPAAAARARPNRGKAKRAYDESRHPSRKRRAQAHPHQQAGGGVQSAGKRKGKGKGKARSHHRPPKDPTPPPPLPPGCANCNECQMCQDGTCVPDPALGGVPCQGSGPACNHCLNGQCVATEQPPCEDGFCARRGQCCPGEQYCPDRESTLGYACVGQTDCCPGQKKCSNGACVSYSNCCDDSRPQCGACDTAICDHGSWYCPGTCCPTQKQCPDGTCVATTACCPGEHQCPDGSCIRNFDCCPGERECSDGTCSPANVCCLGEKRCADGSCKECCPEKAPSCGECEAATCLAGEYICSPSGACGPQCGEGYCPKGYWCHALIACCNDEHCICPSGYTGGCNGRCCKEGCCSGRCCEWG